MYDQTLALVSRSAAQAGRPAARELAELSTTPVVLAVGVVAQGPLRLPLRLLLRKHLPLTFAALRIRS